MDIFGIDVPLWILFLIGIVAVVVVWKLLKFALKIALIIIVFFVILFGLDYFNVFDSIQNIISIVI